MLKRQTRLVSIHVLAGRTTALDVSRYIGINAHKQAIPTFATKACALATKSHMLNFCEVLKVRVTAGYRPAQAQEEPAG